jgi:hypothetical protein
MAVAGDAEEQQLALGGLERLVDRPGAAARRNRRRSSPVIAWPAMCSADQERGRFAQRF